VYFAKNVAYFPFNSRLSFQRLCRLLWGYHFHFVDITVPNFVKIDKTVTEISQFFVIFTMAAAAILVFQKV